MSQFRFSTFDCRTSGSAGRRRIAQACRLALTLSTACLLAAGLQAQNNAPPSGAPPPPSSSVPGPSTAPPPAGHTGTPSPSSPTPGTAPAPPQSDSGSTGSGATAGHPANPGAPAAIMQLKKELSGDFTYRFITPTETGAAPQALPAPAGTDGIVPLPIPAALKGKDAQLEITDTGRGNVARLKATTTGVTSLNESAFKFVQTVFVPVQSKGLGATGLSVSLANASKKYTANWLLKPSDNGVAQFQNVPLGEPITVTVQSGSNPPYSTTQTLSRNATPDGYHWPAIALDWPDIKTVAPPPAPPPPKSDASPAPPMRSTDTDRDPARDERGGGNGFASLLNSLLGLAAVVGIGYGLYWAYNAGKFKTFFDKAGINTAANAGGAAIAPNPFTKPERTPITPITEGTAEPFGNAPVGAGTYAAAASPMPSGPRLIATAGSYSGNIFPLEGSSDIGRDTTNAVPLPQDTNTSRRHATIAGGNGQFTITDNGSSNGTFVNGVRIASQTPTPLRSGDEVSIGTTRFRFEA